MASLAGSLFFYILLIAFTTESSDISVYFFGICFASGMTPCQTLYPVECLEDRRRAKGGSIKFLFVNIAMIVNAYGISIGIKQIAWKPYLVYIV
ncbi:hypothetical protein BHE90_000459 [Fusarium euwallaceae]|uniref:Major facilitator superfamily (MFS) profile domain-containing protein n=1 Tax=Fusarium euwallaceae TaxID=1147111 RepID=A0A430MAK1_9HYPO|nr:hypothetical protein BHE90_000459 [Fusarium euwallaceae]